MKKSKFSLVISCAALACSAMAMQVAQAAGVVDQSQLSYDTGIPLPVPESHFNTPVGQSFTAGLSGTLSNIMLGSNGPILEGTNSVKLEVRDGAGIAGALLGTKTLTVSDVWTQSMGLYVLDMDIANLGITVQSGHQYTFDIASVYGSGDLALRGVLGTTANPYANGRMYVDQLYGDQPEWDLVFQTSVSAVPEPETYGMLLAGLGIMAFLTGRRKVIK